MCESLWFNYVLSTYGRMTSVTIRPTSVIKSLKKILLLCTKLRELYNIETGTQLPSLRHWLVLQRDSWAITSLWTRAWLWLWRRSMRNPTKLLERRSWRRWLQTRLMTWRLSRFLNVSRRNQVNRSCTETYSSLNTFFMLACVWHCNKH